MRSSPDGTGSIPSSDCPALERHVALHDAQDIRLLAHALDEGLHRLIPHSFQLNSILPSLWPPMPPPSAHQRGTLVYSLPSAKNLPAHSKKRLETLDKAL